MTRNWIEMKYSEMRCCSDRTMRRRKAKMTSLRIVSLKLRMTSLKIVSWKTKTTGWNCYCSMLKNWNSMRRTTRLSSRLTWLWLLRQCR